MESQIVLADRGISLEKHKTKDIRELLQVSVLSIYCVKKFRKHKICKIRGLKINVCRA